jgi:transcriptional regulator with XRE-family HTH domain
MTEKQVDRKYKYTKQLVRLAIDHGMTNKEIAKKAGLSDKSVAQVTRWRNGDSLATERQMRFFINEFGDLLKRKMEHLFYGPCQNGGEGLKYYKLDGEIILKYSARKQVLIHRRKANVALLRLVILKQDNQYHLVYQARIGLSEHGFHDAGVLESLAHSENEEANWKSLKYFSQLDGSELIELVDKVAEHLACRENVAKTVFNHDAMTLKFIIRQALLKQGIMSNDIIDFIKE